jgi:hypothetical protein
VHDIVSAFYYNLTCSALESPVQPSLALTFESLYRFIQLNDNQFDLIILLLLASLCILVFLLTRKYTRPHTHLFAQPSPLELAYEELGRVVKIQNREIKLFAEILAEKNHILRSQTTSVKQVLTEQGEAVTEVQALSSSKETLNPLDVTELSNMMSDYPTLPSGVLTQEDVNRYIHERAEYHEKIKMGMVTYLEQEESCSAFINQKIF